MNNETMPGFLVSIMAGFVMLFITLVELILVFRIKTTVFGELLQDFVFTILFIVVIIHLVLSILITIGSVLLKHEDHSLSGSIIVLGGGMFGLLLGAGLFIGSIQAIIGGVMGLKEHQKILLGKEGKIPARFTS